MQLNIMIQTVSLNFNDLIITVSENLDPSDIVLTETILLKMRIF